MLSLISLIFLSGGAEWKFIRRHQKVQKLQGEGERWREAGERRQGSGYGSGDKVGEEQPSWLQVKEERAFDDHRHLAAFLIFVIYIM